MIDLIIGKTEHIPIIQDIANKTWHITYGNILTKEQSEYMLDMMYSDKSLLEQMQNGQHFFLAKSPYTGNIMGFVSYEFNYKGQNKTKLHKLYVLPESQGSGLGKILINAVVEKAREHNSSAVSLNMNRNNKALDFYKRMGFEIAGEEDINIGNGYLMEDYIFEKVIK
ncbi:GNAT family N-acetyltransferase [Dysgonomonas sp. 520]|uniref:GNAT family N-acetyltransferase n=1 Tax=Dysgonomonas sp. 520 TaxID=2302931 RepID=UPI0013D7ACB1|nr:GNAT family N-acetyltransferase [Dysgonomonas sp. 520]NDW09378.1 GNAT family N-acetyltransferase [Dysgonomonas sp. 520]